MEVENDCSPVVIGSVSGEMENRYRRGKTEKEKNKHHTIRKLKISFVIHKFHFASREA